jgi:hypothetical protein
MPSAFWSSWKPQVSAYVSTRCRRLIFPVLSRLDSTNLSFESTRRADLGVLNVLGLSWNLYGQSVGDEPDAAADAEQIEDSGGFNQLVFRSSR